MSHKSCFTHQDPAQFIADTCLSAEEKINILQDWAREEYQKLVADEENMRAADEIRDKNKLRDVLNALLKLGVEFDPSLGTVNR